MQNEIMSWEEAELNEDVLLAQLEAELIAEKALLSSLSNDDEDGMGLLY